MLIGLAKKKNRLFMKHIYLLTKFLNSPPETPERSLHIGQTIYTDPKPLYGMRDRQVNLQRRIHLGRFKVPYIEALIRIYVNRELAVAFNVNHYQL